MTDIAHELAAEPARPKNKGWWSRNIGRVSMAITMGAMEQSGMSPEAIAATFSQGDEERIIDRETRERDLSDLGVYPDGHQHSDLLFLDTPPGAEPGLT